MATINSDFLSQIIMGRIKLSGRMAVINTRGEGKSDGVVNVGTT